MYGRYLRSIVLCCLLICLYSSASSAEIHDAARRGDIATVKQLISQNLDNVKAKNDRGVTPLHMACDSGCIDVATFLIENGADLYAVDSDGDTPLHWAAYSGYSECVTLLIDKGVPVDILNTAKNSPFHYAAMLGRIDVISLLLEKGTDINLRNHGGETPVHLASQRRQADAIRLLVEKGADLEIADNYGRTPLLITARERGHIPTAELLLDLGANINAKDYSDDTPLILATWRGFSELVDLFLDRGAEFDHTGDKGAFLLSYSAQKNVARLFNLLVERGADLSIANNRGGSLLHSAAYSGSIGIITTLLERGFDVNETDNYGRTPIHYASERGRIEAAQLLIENGANLKARTLSGLSAYNLAENFDKEDMQKLLWAKGSCKVPQKLPALINRYMSQPPPGDTPIPFAMDIVSSHEGEHGCITFSPDNTEAFWSSNFMINETGYSTGNILHSRFEDGRWTIPEFPSFCPDFDNSGDVPYFAPDGKRLYFITRRPLLPGQQGGKENIWYANKRDDGWSDAIPVGPAVNSMDTHWQFGVDNDYNIYFTTSDERGLGMADIYLSRYENGEYQNPEHMGPVLNSEASEGTPFIAPDASYIMFTRHGSHDSAGNGMFISYKNQDGGWDMPVRLNDELGIEKLGLCPIVSPDGDYLFTINRTTGQGNVHWMRADFIDRLRP